MILRKALSLYPTRLKIWFRTEAKAPAIGAIESSPLLEIGARFDRPIPGLWLGLKSKFSIALSIAIFISFLFRPLCGTSIAEQFERAGYLEISDKHGTAMFDSLYAYFDVFTEFLQKNPSWAQKLYSAKERFVRSKDRNYCSTDFFGLYDESKREGRSQVCFYYSNHFHEFICSRYPEFSEVPEIVHFFEACLKTQKPYGSLFSAAASELGLETIFSSEYKQPPILLKIVKYLPSYIPGRPHYDGTAFSLFLHSTDNQSLLLSPYKSSLTIDDFSSPPREFSNSVLLIPGAFLTEFFIYPTPHIVAQSSKIRYATIAFAMRPYFVPP